MNLVREIRNLSKMGGKRGLILTTGSLYLDTLLKRAGLTDVQRVASGKYTAINHHGEDFSLMVVNPCRNYMGAVSGCEFDFIIVKTVFINVTYTESRGFSETKGKLGQNSTLSKCLEYCLSRVRGSNPMDKNLSFPPLSPLRKRVLSELFRRY